MQFGIHRSGHPLEEQRLFSILFRLLPLAIIAKHVFIGETSITEKTRGLRSFVASEEQCLAKSSPSKWASAATRLVVSSGNGFAPSTVPLSFFCFVVQVLGR